MVFDLVCELYKNPALYVRSLVPGMLVNRIPYEQRRKTLPISIFQTITQANKKNLSYNNYILVKRRKRNLIRKEICTTLVFW